MPAPRPLLFVHKVVPSTTTYTSSSGSFKVPNYNRFAIKMWGAGASGGGLNISGASGTLVAGNNGGASTVSATGISITAHGGYGGYSARTPVGGRVGGTASGANTVNKQGGASNGNTPGTGGGAGGAGAYGGAGGPGGNGGAGSSGSSGGAPGGGGGGCYNSGASYFAGGGGSGGAYAYSLFGPGVSAAPAPGSIITWSVGAGGAAVGSSTTSGAGARGQVTFQVS